MRFLKRAIFIVFLLLVIVVGGAVATFYLAPTSWIMGVASDSVREQTGRELTVTGEIERGLFPLSVRVTGVALSNADWAGEEPMIEAEAAVITLRTVPLLGGSVEIEEIALVDPVVRVAISEGGLSNFDFERVEDRRDTSGGGMSSGGADDLILVSGALQNGRVLIDNRNTGQMFEITDINVNAARPTVDAAFTLDGGASVIDRSAGADATPRALLIAASMGGDAPAFIRISSGEALSIELTPDAGASADQVSGQLEVTFDGSKTGAEWMQALSPVIADLASATLSGPVTFAENAASATLSGSAVYKGVETTIDTLRAAAAPSDNGAATALEVELRATNTLVTAAIGGDVVMDDEGAAQRVGASVEISTSDLRSLAQWIGGDIEIRAPENTLRNVSMKSTIAIDDQSTAFSDLDVKIDNASLTGGLTTTRFTVADLQSDEDDAETTSAASTADGWSAEPIAVFDLLKGAGGAIALDTADMPLRQMPALSDLPFDSIALTASLEGEDQLVLSITQMTLYEGSASGVIALDASPASNGPNLTVRGLPGGDVSNAVCAAVADGFCVSGVKMAPLLEENADVDWLSGDGAFALRLDGTGQSLDALMNSLNGQASFKVLDGSIVSEEFTAAIGPVLLLASSPTDISDLSDVGGLLQLAEQGSQTFTSEDGGVEFLSLGADFTIADGVASSSNIALALPPISVTGDKNVDDGTVDIGGRSVSLTADIALTVGGTPYTIPMTVTGPWSDVGVGVDESVLSEIMAAESTGGSDGVGGVVNELIGGGQSNGGDGGSNDALGGALDALGGGSNDDEDSGGVNLPFSIGN